MVKGKTIIRDTIIILIITIVLLVILEVLLRLLYPRDDFKAEKISYQYDSTLLIILRTAIDRTYVRDKIDGGQSIQWKINEQGFRHGPMQKGIRRIMVYGDSNVQGVFSKDDDTYCARLEHYLSQACGETVEVVNAGVVGYGPDQCLLKFERELSRFRPDDAIFVLFGHNDYGDIIRNRIFELDSDSNLVMTKHERLLDPLLKKPGMFDVFRILDMVKVLQNKAGLTDPLTPGEVKQITIQQYQDLCASQFEHYIQGGPNTYSHFFDNYDIDIATVPLSQSSKIKCRLMEEVLEQIALTAFANGIRLYFVILPSAIDITFNRSINPDDLRKFPGYAPDNLTRPMESAGRKMNVPTLNLFHVFTAEKESSILYFSGAFNDHWTDYGQDLAARKTAEMICPEQP